MSYGPVKILLVDDLEDNLLALVALLQREDLECLTARSGTEALELLLVHEVALAIIDVQMPGMDGFETAELMRGMERTRRVPIIFLTAGVKDEYRRFRGYEAGAVDFLFKPIETHILQSKVGVFCELYRQRQELVRQRDELFATAEMNARLLAESRRAAEALQDSEARFRALADNMSQLAWMADETGWRFWFNQRWYEYTGTTLEDVQGWEWQKVHHPDHVERVVKTIAHAFNTVEPWEDTFPLRGKDGQYRWFLSRAVPICDDNCETLRWVGTSTDITERLEIEERLRKSESSLRELNESLEQRVIQRTEELTARNDELQQFAFVASHDFQEPLRKIQTFGNLLLTETAAQLDAESRGYVERMHAAAVRMSKLLQDMLAFTRVASREPSLTEVNLAQLVHVVLNDLELNIEELRARVEVEVNAVITGDENQLRHVINHLLLNALKFRKENVPPHIRITAKIGPPDEAVPDRFRAEPNVCRIVVEDSGIGFDPKYAERIFRPFERLHGKSRYPGTGMGLAICRRIVERHGGTIQAFSVPDEGSRFTIILPLRPVHDPRTETIGMDETSSAENLHSR